MPLNPMDWTQMRVRNQTHEDLVLLARVLGAKTPRSEWSGVEPPVVSLDTVVRWLLDRWFRDKARHIRHADKMRKSRPPTTEVDTGGGV